MERWKEPLEISFLPTGKGTLSLAFLCLCRLTSGTLPSPEASFIHPQCRAAVRLTCDIATQLLSHAAPDNP